MWKIRCQINGENVGDPLWDDGEKKQYKKRGVYRVNPGVFGRPSHRMQYTGIVFPDGHESNCCVYCLKKNQNAPIDLLSCVFIPFFLDAGRPGSSEVPRNPPDTLGREFDPGKRYFSH